MTKRSRGQERYLERMLGHASDLRSRGAMYVPDDDEIIATGAAEVSYLALLDNYEDGAIPEDVESAHSREQVKSLWTQKSLLSGYYSLDGELMRVISDDSLTPSKKQEMCSYLRWFRSALSMRSSNKYRHEVRAEMTRELKEEMSRIARREYHGVGIITAPSDVEADRKLREMMRQRQSQISSDPVRYPQSFSFSPYTPVIPHVRGDYHLSATEDQVIVRYQRDVNAPDLEAGSMRVFDRYSEAYDFAFRLWGDADRYDVSVIDAANEARAGEIDGR